MGSSREHVASSDQQDTITAELIRSGLDLVHWFSVDRCNARLQESSRLPNDRSPTHGLFVANSSALWTPFVAHLLAPESQGQSDPLDSYVETTVRKALSEVDTTYLAFAHCLDPAPIPIQQYAEASGFAPRGPAGLSIHHQYGPWFALRAIALVRVDTDPRFSPRITEEESPCRGCSAPCRAPFDAALHALEASPAHASTRLFLPSRDACPVGREHRYSDEQLTYHYDKTSPLLTR